MKIGVRKLKTWNTHDGGGYQGELLVDDKPALHFHNDGNGGETRIEPLNKDLMAALDAHIKAQPPRSVDVGTGEPWITPCDIQYVIADAIDDHEHTKRMKRLCKTKTLFQLRSEMATDVIRQIPQPYTDKLKAHILEKYGADTVIINEQFQ